MARTTAHDSPAGPDRLAGQPDVNAGAPRPQAGAPAAAPQRPDMDRPPRQGADTPGFDRATAQEETEARTGTLPDTRRRGADAELDGPEPAEPAEPGAKPAR
ncbi:hypothetical protein V8Z80_10160 [Orrella sp. JC864]|uniref:hypothetical protein n=1 Tax=Orrella sp. JC864 TaxID=3120298 RepID=UPI00300800FA